MMAWRMRCASCVFSSARRTLAARASKYLPSLSHLFLHSKDCFLKSINSLSEKETQLEDRYVWMALSLTSARCSTYSQIVIPVFFLCPRPQALCTHATHSHAYAGLACLVMTSSFNTVARADGCRLCRGGRDARGYCHLWLRSFASCLVSYDHSVLVMLELHVLNRAMVMSSCHEWDGHQTGQCGLTSVKLYHICSICLQAHPSHISGI